MTVAGASFLTAIGSVCKSFEQTNALAGTLLIVLMLFDGNWINRRNIRFTIVGFLRFLF